MLQRQETWNIRNDKEKKQPNHKPKHFFNNKQKDIIINIRAKGTRPLPCTVLSLLSFKQITNLKGKGMQKKRMQTKRMQI